MATRTWDNGADDGIFITAANWSGDTAPVDTDTAIIAASSKSIASADHSSIELAALRVLPGWGGTATGMYLGSSGSTLKIDATELEINNSRFAWINLEGIYPTVYARKLGGPLYFGPTSDIGTLYVPPGGKVIVDVGAKLATAYVYGTLEVRGDTSTPDDMEIHIARGATVDCYRRIALGFVNGTLNCKGGAEGDASGTSKIHIGSTGSMSIESTGNFDFISTEPGSRLDGTKQIGGSSTITVTTIIRADGARISMPKSLFTFTNDFSPGVEDTFPG